MGFDDMTDSQRLILINQYKILKEIKKSEEYDKNIELLEKGYLCLLEKLTQPINKEEYGFILDLLDIHMVVKNSLEDIQIKYSPQITFHSNSESKYFNFIEELKTQGKYLDVNVSLSISEMEKYRELVNFWEKLNKPYIFNKEQVDIFLQIKNRK